MENRNIQNKNTEKEGTFIVDIAGSPNWPADHAANVANFITTQLDKEGYEAMIPMKYDMRSVRINGYMRSNLLTHHLLQQVNNMPKNPDEIQIAFDALQYGIQIGATITDKQEIKEHIKNYLSNLK